ncbi:MAG: hypothetical protein ABI970_02670, partial [Chloroflexota bacterium]
MINPLHFSGQLLRTFGNLLEQQQESTIKANKSNNYPVASTDHVLYSELHIAYMDVSHNVILLILKG